jgi:hypothetical protein
VTPGMVDASGDASAPAPKPTAAKPLMPEAP